MKLGDYGDIPDFLSPESLDQALSFTPFWCHGIHGEGITVAVLDTGINIIPEIKDSLILEKDFTGENNFRDTDKEHGTKIAQNITRIAPKVNIANFKVVPQHNEPDKKTVSQAVKFCIDKYPLYRVINLSLWFHPEGCSKNKQCILCSTVNEAVKRGIVVIAAAGNLGPKPGTITCPGLAEKAITTGSTSTKAEIQWMESLSWFKRKLLEASGKFEGKFGTSFSTAYISGGVALILSAFKKASPTPDEIKDALKNSCIDPALPVPKFDNAYGLLKYREFLYEEYKRVFFHNRQNKSAQEANSSYLTERLEFMLNFIEERLITQQQYETSTKELTEIQSYIIDNSFQLYQQRIEKLLNMCNNKE